MEQIQFLKDDGTFTMKKPENYSGLYYPIAGEKGLKSAVTPNFSGDSKLNQNAFLLEPVSIENLHNNRSGRNFWCAFPDGRRWSAVGFSAEAEALKFTDMQDESQLTAGFMWQTMERTSETYQLQVKVTEFVSISGDAEVMYVELTNIGEKAQTFSPVAAVPIYGRSADNIRDHRHVTSLLHEIRTTEHGVYVKPTLSFDERGHQKNELTYFVCGVAEDGTAPKSFYPTVDSFLGEGGTFTNPRALREHYEGVPAGSVVNGKEALGGICFEEITLEPNATACYTVLMGVTEDETIINNVIASYKTAEQTRTQLEEVKAYWKEKVNVSYYTGDVRFDNFMQWVSFQPILRRIYGCSFLPHHDYGKGGRGWRDLWQDCLALLLMNPSGVRQMILDNFGGVRMDGSNATIIGEKQGEFVADRNNITRVWMDHGFWPFLTTKLYIDETGDVELFNENIAYFKDKQVERGTAIDEAWGETYGNLQKTEDGRVYYGTVLEHLLLQNLCAFYEVGEHNHMRLRGADWNDALDMAEHRGESVAFTCAYAGNMIQIAEYLKLYQEKTKKTTVSILKEMELLLADDTQLYEDSHRKQELLNRYAKNCCHDVSGEQIEISIEELRTNLLHKAEWMMEHIRKTEWTSDNNGNHWFNSYYDNHGDAVEGSFAQGIRMMLTGQVFSIMSGTATEEQVREICKSADTYLYEKEIGGYRLNTNFGEQKFDLGRMFGFAYGEKENGAVFSHMSVMYANALYQRGFVKEGHKALSALSDVALHFETSKMYPGIPEYFNNEGRGLYSYLTGAASWYMLTMITEVFGVKGKLGNLVFEPKLVKEQFDEKGLAKIALTFGGKKFEVSYHNPNHLDYGQYRISNIAVGENVTIIEDGAKAILLRETIANQTEAICKITIELA